MTTTQLAADLKISRYTVRRRFWELVERGQLQPPQRRGWLRLDEAAAKAIMAHHERNRCKRGADG